MDSPVVAEIDIDAPGKRTGVLRVPRSTNSAAWSSLTIPVVAIVGKAPGPTVLVTGGVHGDEPVGTIAASALARETAPGDVRGRLIVIPTLNPETTMAATRLWASGANLNRSFPGRPDGAPDEQLAGFLTTTLMPVSDVVVDLHAGGRTLACLPWSEMHLVEDVAQRRAMVDGMLAWNLDWHFVYIDIAGHGLLVGEAERQGKVVISTELGGGDFVPRELHARAAAGLANALRTVGALAGEPTGRAALGLPPATVLRATDRADYVLSPGAGLFEALVDLGATVDAGQTVGRLHDVRRPDRAPEEIVAAGDGVVCAIRAIAATDHGDTVVVIGHPVNPEELSS